MKEQVFNMKIECQQKIEQAREEYQELKLQLELERESRSNDLVELENYSSIGNETHKILQPFGQKNDEQMKKKYDKKI